MAIKLIIIHLIIFSCQSVFGQLEIIDIKLNKNKSTIKVISDTILYIEKKTIIKVDYNGDGSLTLITNSEGQVKNLQHGRFEISFPINTNSKATVLKFYERTPKNRLQLLELKTYYLKHIPAPQITIGGVKNDSAINIEHLIRDYTVRANHPINKQKLTILDFYIQFPKEDSLYVKGSKMPISIKNNIYTQKQGSILTLYNIRTLMPDKSIYLTKKVAIFLVLNDQYSVGKRKYIKP